MKRTIPIKIEFRPQSSAIAGLPASLEKQEFFFPRTPSKNVMDFSSETTSADGILFIKTESLELDSEFIGTDWTSLVSN